MPIIFSWLIYSLASPMQCTINPLLQTDASFPIALQGKLIYHAYNTYGDGTSNLFLKDFLSNTLIQLNQDDWNIVDPMNAHFSPDGQHIVFMGKQNTRWNIFIWKLNSPFPPLNLSHHTEEDGGSSEDPKFSPDGRYIVYKNNSDIMMARVNFTDPHNPSLDNTWHITYNGETTEESMPYFSSDGHSIFYSQGADETSDIHQISFKIKDNQVIIGNSNQVAAKQGLTEFYPVVHNHSLFFVGWKEAFYKKDQIYLRNDVSWNAQLTELKLNDCNADNSDPTPIDSTHIVFSSTRNSEVYNLYLGDIYTGEVWSLNQFGVNQPDTHQLGPVYTNMR